MNGEMNGGRGGSLLAMPKASVRLVRNGIATG